MTPKIRSRNFYAPTGSHHIWKRSVRFPLYRSLRYKLKYTNILANFRILVAIKNCWGSREDAYPSGYIGYALAICEIFRELRPIYTKAVARPAYLFALAGLSC